MTTYGSLPGACHRPWCWTTTVAALEERGHRAIAIDLPCDDVTAGFERYVEVTRQALDGAHDDVVLVGHSLGAHTAVRASHVMPVAAVLFVCGVIPPREGEDTSDEPHLEAKGGSKGSSATPRSGSSSPIRPTRSATSSPTSTPRPAPGPRRSSSRSRRRRIAHQRPSKPAVGAPRVDRVHGRPCGDGGLGRWAARERLLDAPVVELPGSHSPFLSRPADLADALVELRGRL